MAAKVIFLVLVKKLKWVPKWRLITGLFIYLLRI